MCAIIKICLALCLLAVSCHEAKKRTFVNDPKYSINELKLIGIDSTMKVLKIDFSVGKDSIFRFLQLNYHKQICDSGVNFGLEMGPRIVKLHASNQCGIYCGLSPYMNIEVPAQPKKVAINYQYRDYDVIPLDSLKASVANFIRNEVLHSKKTSNVWIGIRLKYTERSRQDMALKAIEQVIDGFSIGLNTLSQNWFHKPVYALDAIQLEMIRSNVHFELEIGYGIDEMDDIRPTERFYELKPFKNNRKSTGLIHIDTSNGRATEL